MLKGSGPRKDPCEIPQILEHTVDIADVYGLSSKLYV